MYKIVRLTGQNDHVLRNALYEFQLEEYSLFSNHLQSKFKRSFFFQVIYLLILFVA